MNDLIQILLNNLLLSAGLFAVLWWIATRVRDPSFVDAWWALGIVVLAWATYGQLETPSGHATALLLLATGWGLRLGVYLLWRWAKHGPDRRYMALGARANEKHGLDFEMFSMLWVFAPQFALQFLVAMPVMAGQAGAGQSWTLLAQIGLVLAVAGLVFESVADAQIAHFKSASASHGAVMDQGLWRYSRHPNYFGELCVWWGLWMIAADAGMGVITLCGPLLITYLITCVSGAPTSEPQMHREKPGYREYYRRTSALFPLPPHP